jgi:hypothetical protein
MTALSEKVKSNISQQWHDEGYKSFGEGKPKMATWQTNAKHFNQGWRAAEQCKIDADEQEQLDKAAQDVQAIKDRICNYGDTLDTTELATLLLEMGATL